MKRFFVIFSVCFTVLFLLFSINAIYSILKYKISHFRENFILSLKRPINFSPEIEGVSIAETVENVLNFNNPIIFREPLPEIPAEAMSQDMLVLPKFDIKTPLLTVSSENKKEIYASLKNGVVIYPTTSYPGGEYSIVLGHSSRYPWEPGKYKAVFSLLNELAVGDKIHVF